MDARSSLSSPASGDGGTHVAAAALAVVDVAAGKREAIFIGSPSDSALENRELQEDASPSVPHAALECVYILTFT